MELAAWQIKSHMAHLSGRKSVIWVSAECPYSLYGADFNVYIVDAKGIPGFPEIRAEKRAATDVVPLSWGPATGEDMRQVAASTGGVAFTWGNDIRGAIDKAMTDADLTYTLGFYPATADKEAQSGEGARSLAALRSFTSPFYHKLKIEVRRPGVTAHYRERYSTRPYEPSPERRVADAIASPIDTTQLAIGARVASTGSSLQLPITIGAGDIVLGASAGRRTGTVDLIVVQRASGGAELATMSRSLVFEVEDRKYAEFLKQDIRVTLDLEPKPGLAEVKIVALDRSSGRVGSLTIPARHE